MDLTDGCSSNVSYSSNLCRLSSQDPSYLVVDEKAPQLVTCTEPTELVKPRWILRDNVWVRGQVSFSHVAVSRGPRNREDPNSDRHLEGWRTRFGRQVTSFTTLRNLKSTPGIKEETVIEPHNVDYYKWKDYVEGNAAADYVEALLHDLLLKEVQREKPTAKYIKLSRYAIVGDFPPKNETVTIFAAQVDVGDGDILFLQAKQGPSFVVELLSPIVRISP